MDLNKTIQILEALASGCSPITGEVLSNESVLNERIVIRALQVAIDQLKKKESALQNSIEIGEQDIQNAFNLFHEQKKTPTTNNLVGFFLGTRQFKNHALTSHELYGKFKAVFTNGQLLDFFNQYLQEKNIVNNNGLENAPYREIDFFQKDRFNKLSEKAINQLKERVDELGMVKTENLSQEIKDARISHPRAYEPWSDKEKQLLTKAIEYTNDLDILSKCFQRGKGSIESCGQRLLYDARKHSDH